VLPGVCESDTKHKNRAVRVRLYRRKGRDRGAAAERKRRGCVNKRRNNRLGGGERKEKHRGKREGKIETEGEHIKSEK